MFLIEKFNLISELLNFPSPILNFEAATPPKIQSCADRRMPFSGERKIVPAMS
jgi:hypothetical protein